MDSSPFPTTIIQGADQTVTCPNDGSTLAKFFLCGTSDTRTLTLAAAGNTYEWQQLDPNTCAPTVVEDCPTINTSCGWNTVGGQSTFTLNSPGEYRVRVDGGTFYYFKASQNPLDPQIVYEDISCGTPGLIEVVNVPEGYEYSLNSPSGPFQEDPFFTVASGGEYRVYVRLQNVGASACIFPSNQVTVQELSMTASASFTDILCFGDQGSISVQVGGVPGFYTYRLVRNGVTVDTFGPSNNNTYTFSNAGPGDYEIRVSTNSCSLTVDSDSSGTPLVIGGGISPLEVTADTNESFGCGLAEVSVNLHALGGTGPYRYSLDGGSSFDGSFGGNVAFTVGSPGTYNILVEDANGCTDLASVEVLDIPPPTFSLSATDSNCGGANTGQIVVDVPNSLGYNLSYSIDSGGSFQSSPTFSNLFPGNYTVLVQYEQNGFSCVAPAQSINVGAPNSIQADAVVVQEPSCANPVAGELRIDYLAGGVGPFEYSIGAGFGPDSLFSNLAVGTYTPAIRDANGCVTLLADVVFDPLDEPDDIDFAVGNLDCATGTASVTLTGYGGSGNYTYELLTPSAFAISNGTNPAFIGLPLGTYTFEIRDDQGCSYRESFSLQQLETIRVQGQTLSPVSCQGDTDGTGRFLVDRFSGSYSYQINGGTVYIAQTQSTIALSGLPVGNYTIQVTDETTACSDTATFTIDEPAAPLTIDQLVVEDMNCQNANTGSVTVITSGGWGSNEYRLYQPDMTILGPQGSPSFFGLVQGGNYTLEVTDVNGCQVSDSFSLSPLPSPTLALDMGLSDFCYDPFDAAQLAVTAGAGLPPYEYRINGGAWQASPVFPGLIPGSYTLEVNDSNNCRTQLNATVNPPIRATAFIVQELECAGPDAVIRVNIRDGYPLGSSYDHFEVSIGGGAFSTANYPIAGDSFDYAIPNDGSLTTDTTFEFMVYDSQGCSAVSNPVTISPRELISGNVLVTDTRCGISGTGIVELVPDTSFGVPPYEYSNDSGLTFGPVSVFTGYDAGSHGGFVIRDSRGCESVVMNALVGISDPLDATVTPISATCNSGIVEGAVDIAVNNGADPFVFELWDETGTLVSTQTSSNTLETISGAAPGRYTVVVRDALGCEYTEEIEVLENELDIVPVPILPIDCLSGLNVGINIVGGAGPFLIRLVGEGVPRYSPNNGPRSHIFNGLDLGTTHWVEVEDTGTGCLYIEEIPPYDGPSPLDVTVATVEASCGLTSSGELTFTVAGATGATVDVLLTRTTDGSTVIPLTSYPSAGPFPALTGLDPGEYQVTVYDPFNGCEDSDIGRISLNNPAISVIDNTPANCFRGALVTVSGSRGTPGYEYAVVSSGDPAPAVFGPEASFELPAPATYDFYLRDSEGCVVFITETVTELPPMPAATIDVVNQCTASSGFQIDVTAPLSTGSGLPGETFQYDIGGGFQDSPQFIVPNAGTYTITIRDGWGCTQTINAEVFDFFSITADASSEPTCNAGDGVITVVTTGGSGNFEYQLLDTFGLPVLPVQNTPDFINISPGSYQVVVTDLSSNTVPLCSDTTTVEVSLVTNPVISSAQVTEISCAGSSDATIRIGLQPGTDTDIPLQYSLLDSGGSLVFGPQASSLFTGVGPGTYTAEVVSQRGCTDTRPNIVVSDPLPLQIQTAQSDFSCDSGSGDFSTANLEIFMDTFGDGSGTPTGTPPYLYSIDDGTPTFNGTQFQSSNLFQIIDRGLDQNIEVIVRDRNGCEIRTNVVFPSPADLTFSFDLLPPTCDTTGYGVQAGSITVIINEGPGNYEVELMPLGSSTPVSSGGTDRAVIPVDIPGSYVFAVRDLDNGGCAYLTPIVDMPDFNTVEAVLREYRPVTCFGAMDGEVALEVTGYSGPYTYEIYSRTPAGDVTTGVSGTLDSSISTGEEIVGGLPAGNLFARIEALDSPYCDTESNVATVRSPDRPLGLTLTQTAVVTCALPGLGEITVSGDGGWGNYQYRLVEASTGQVLVDYPNNETVFEGLNGGTYDVFIRDYRGCEEVGQIELLVPEPIQASVQQVQPLACPGDNNASIEAYNISGGQGPGNYLYQLIRLNDGSSSGLQSTPRFNNLASGRYAVTVYDGWSCSETTAEIEVEDPMRVDADLVELQPPGCGDLGRMRLRITNPESGMEYFYRRSGSSDPFVPFGSGVYETEIAVDINIDPGPFMYDVQNSNGCPYERSNQISLDPAAPLVIALDLTNATINCAGEATGIIRSEAFGGIGNYRYTLLNDPGAGVPEPGNTVRPEQDSGIFRNLDPGTYYVFARSGGCEAISPPIEILPREPLVLDYFEVMDVSCAGDSDGQIILEASGGTGRIRYSISDTLSEFFEGDDPTYPNRKTFDNLPPRSYDIIVQDDLGCTITRTVTVGSPPPLIASIGEVVAEICYGDEDSRVYLQVQGGVPPYETSINSVDEEDFEPNPNLELIGLPGGQTYLIFIRDSRGCIAEVPVEVPPGLRVEVTPQVTYGCSEIFAYNTVTIRLEDPRLRPDMLFAIDSDDINLATSDLVYGNLLPGEHYVYAFHSSGCFDRVEFTIDDYEPLVLEVEKTDVNEYTARATGGFGGYEYSFQEGPFSEENVFYLFRDTEVVIRVRDQGGCVAMYRTQFDFDAMPRFPNYFTPDGDLLNDVFTADNGHLFPNMTIKIYDRYGRIVARLEDVKKWDGTYVGKPVPTGDYWYVVEPNNGESPTIFGHFTLYR